MKAIIVGYLIVGLIVGLALEKPASWTFDEIVTMGLIHVGLAGLATLGIWHSRKHGEFMGLSRIGWIVAIDLSYMTGFGAGVAFWILGL